MHRKSYVIRRDAFSAPSGEIARHQFGNEWGWGWGIAGTLQSLASPFSGGRVPAAPGPNDPLEQALGYWGALHYLLLYRLGWEQPHRGLDSWTAAGQPTDDGTLRLITEVWGEDFGLERYFAWSLTRQAHFDLRKGQLRNGLNEPADARMLREKGSRLFESLPPAHWSALGAVGSDPLHLTGHFIHADGATGSGALHVLDPSEQRALLVTKSMYWLPELLSFEHELPMRGVHSWKVNVVIENVGLIGTYRRSAKTGLWFTGKHGVHMLGN